MFVGIFSDEIQEIKIILDGADFYFERFLFADMFLDKQRVFLVGAGSFQRRKNNSVEHKIMEFMI